MEFAMMQDTISRLRREKQEFDASEREIGADDGRTWARDDGEYADLIRLSRVDVDSLERDGVNLLGLLLNAIVGCEPVDLFGDKADDLSDPYLLGFIEGAQAFFTEIKAKL